ncbi:MAG: hypothetical protein N4A35_05500 [Flavobacteriales bacterium]|jgi:hypothetical protein|nr:hypothetical protein [Flavobacteriales bacterium]
MKRKKKNTSKSKISQLLEEYNRKETKGQVEHTLLKSTIDIASVAGGTGLGALSGEKAKLIGPLLILLGHYIGDKSGLLRMLGASTLTYGIAKSKDLKENQNLLTVKGRLNDLKDNWLTAMYLEVEKKKRNKESGSSNTKSTTKKIDKSPINQKQELPKEPTTENSLEGSEDTLDFTNF